MLARKNIQSLSDFVRDCKGDIAAANTLVTAIVDGPIPSEFHFSNAGQYVLKEYKDRKKAEASFSGAATVYLEFALDKVLSFGIVLAKLSAQKQIAFAAEIREIFHLDLLDKANSFKTQQHFYALSHAAYYQLTHYGACSYRACYAAIKLYEMLKNTGISVAIQSNAECDHFVVAIYNKEIGSYIYDPLTNPRMLYDGAFYKKNILSTFPKVVAPKQAMTCVMTEDLFKLYTEQLPSIENYFLDQLAKCERDTTVLMKNKLLVDAFLINKVPPKDLEKTLLRVIEKADEIVKSHSKINTPK